MDDERIGNWEPAMVELSGFLADELVRAGQGEQASDLAARLVVRICQEFGGQTWYLPRGAALERARRNLAIWQTYDGTVHGANGILSLASRYGITDVYVYRILASKTNARNQQKTLDLGKH